MAEIAPGEEQHVGKSAEPIALALIRYLYHSETIDQDDVNEIADALDADAETQSAHEVRLTMLPQTSQAEWEVQQRRSRMEIVPNNGGNRG